MTKSWALLFAIGFAGCAPAYSIPQDNGDCNAACAVLAKWQCPEGKPTPNGAPCVAVCEANRELLSVSCVAVAESIDGLRACRVGCAK